MFEIQPYGHPSPSAHRLREVRFFDFLAVSEALLGSLPLPF
ncbi:uncharacterized protein G2W53_021964 [Senna tora]|uniref:Uncharacterized protein n=1 Tax=Senna tora TaxID=362788 RepID=A0A834WHQ1_9FABA|nr:uncharacterized protein G2W53_021964 [Senna tora]